MSRPATVEAFNRLLEKAISRSITSGSLTLREIVSRLPGAFPLVVAEHLQRRGLSLQQCAQPVPAAPCEIPSSFILPHPLDYDWRFSSAATKIISQCVREAGAPRRRVLCLGCPSVASTLRASLSEGAVSLLDRNGAIHDAETISWELSSRVFPKENFEIVVADPPWYPRHFRCFLWAIRESCQLGTDVLLAVPPVLTRPGMPSELRRLSSWVEAVGFQLLERIPGALPYVMPLFELNTIRAYGGSDVPIDWRKADLWKLQLASKPRTNPPTLPKEPDSWGEKRFGNTRVRARTGVPIHESMRLRPLGRDGLLPSVSSREPLRAEAALVTSGGRFFAIEEITLNNPSINQAEDATHGSLTLSDVLSLERHEEKEYYGLIRDLIRR